MKYLLSFLLLMLVSGTSHAQSCRPALRPDQAMCPDSVCAAAANQPSFKMMCQCKDAGGNAIPGCEPKSTAFPIVELACVNSKTKEVKPTQECRTLSAQSDDWDIGQCACCCTN